MPDQRQPRMTAIDPCGRLAVGNQVNFADPRSVPRERAQREAQELAVVEGDRCGIVAILPQLLLKLPIPAIDPRVNGVDRLIRGPLRLAHGFSGSLPRM